MGDLRGNILDRGGQLLGRGADGLRVGQGLLGGCGDVLGVGADPLSGAGHHFGIPQHPAGMTSDLFDGAAGFPFDRIGHVLQGFPSLLLGVMRQEGFPLVLLLQTAPHLVE